MSSFSYNPDPFDNPNVVVSPLSVHQLVPSKKVPIGTWAELWFGSGSHLDPGYKSADAVTVAAQVAAVKARGFDFVVLDWYGTAIQPQHSATLLWIVECEKQGLKFIICYDKGMFQWNVPTGTSVTAWGQQQMAYAVKNFCSSPAYMKHTDGRYLMVNYDVPGITGLDYNKIFTAYPNVAMLFEKTEAIGQPSSSGNFGWVGYDPKNPDGCVEASLTSFLTTTGAKKSTNPKFIIMAALSKGFDDHGRRAGLDPTKSCWDQTQPARIVPEHQGQTLLNAAAILDSTKTSIDYIFTPTWNDYEENTTCGERGVDSQLTISLAAASGVLTATLSGNDATVDHVEMQVNGKTYQGATLDLSTLNPKNGDSFSCQATAVGKPLFQNKTSNSATTTATIVPDQTVQVSVPVHVDTSVTVPVSGTLGGLTVQGSVTVPVQQDTTQTVTATVTTRVIWS